MSRYTASQQHWLIKMLPLANGKAVKAFLSSLLHAQFRRKGFIPHCMANDGLIPPRVKEPKLPLNCQLQPNHTEWWACGLWCQGMLPVHTVIEEVLFYSSDYFILAKPPSKVGLCWLYGIRILKDTVICICSMSFWHKAEINEEKVFWI